MCCVSGAGRAARHGLLWLLLLALCACAALPGKQAGANNSASMQLVPVSFTRLPNWAEQHPAQVLPALWQSCAALLTLPLDQRLGGQGMAAEVAGRAGQWQAACLAARAVPAADDAAARHYFETWFQPYLVGVGSDTLAHFSGYYEPEVTGSLTRDGPYQTPILGLPGNLVTISLGAFDLSLTGRRLTGQLIGNRFEPYPDRAAINAGALDTSHLAIAWVADPVDAYFLELQGFGRIRLPDGQVLRLAYAGSNGRPYVPIGRILAERHLIAANHVTMAAIRDWLEAHPAQGQTVMDDNPNYVFFRVLTGLPASVGPPGALGVPLTPRRSAAIDRGSFPLGVPLYLAADPSSGAPWHKLVIAQDLDDAPHGPLHAELFFGWGAAAAAAAGRVQEAGRLYVFLPRAQPE